MKVRKEKKKNADRVARRAIKKYFRQSLRSCKGMVNKVLLTVNVRCWSQLSITLKASNAATVTRLRYTKHCVKFVSNTN